MRPLTHLQKNSLPASHHQRRPWPTQGKKNALVSLLGLTHVERNAHHFIDGMSAASDAEQEAFVKAHPALYEKQPGKPARLRVSGGKLALGSLDCPGFAVGVDLDFASLRAMPAAPQGRLQPAHPGGKK